MATVNIGLDELMKFVVQASGDWGKTGQTQGVKTKSPATGQVNQQPTGFGQRALSAGQAGIQMPQIPQILGILNQQLQRQGGNQGFSMSNLLQPQQEKGKGAGIGSTALGVSKAGEMAGFGSLLGDSKSTASSIMSILALLGI